MTHKDPTSLENVIAGCLLGDAYKLLKLQKRAASVDWEPSDQKRIRDLINEIEHGIATLQPDLRKKAMEVIQNRHDNPEEYIKQPGSVVTYTAETLQTLCYMILSFNESISMHENDDNFSM